MSKRTERRYNCSICGKPMAEEWYWDTDGVCLSCSIKDNKKNTIKDVAIIKDKKIRKKKKE